MVAGALTNSRGWDRGVASIREMSELQVGHTEQEKGRSFHAIRIKGVERNKGVFKIPKT